MGEWIKLKASDGFELSAWRAAPQGAAKGGDRRHPGDFRRQPSHPRGRRPLRGGRAIWPSRRRCSIASKRTSTRATKRRRQQGHGDRRQDGSREGSARHRRGDRRRGEGGKVGIVGFCLGGSFAWAAAARLSGLSAAVGYYGGHHRQKELQPPGSDDAAFRRKGRAHPGRRRARGRRAAPGRADLPLPRRSRLQLRRARQLRRATAPSSPGRRTLAFFASTSAELVRKRWTCGNACASARSKGRCAMYSALTQKIRVTVRPEFSTDRSEPSDDSYSGSTPSRSPTRAASR